MIKKTIKRNVVQIFAITEKNLKFGLRFKFNLLISYLTPIISIIMPLILMGTIFEFRGSVDLWDETNFIIYELIAYNIALLYRLITDIPLSFRYEKYWETLPALIIAPFKRINLVLGIFFYNLIIVSIPFTIFIILTYIIIPISLLTLLFILVLYFFIALIFAGIGIIIGIFVISRENYLGLLNFCIKVLFLFSCLTYPFYMYPVYIRDVIALNPFYYMFDVLRFSWLENNTTLSISSHPYSFLIITFGAILVPLIAVYIFNKIYKKRGIAGY